MEKIKILKVLFELAGTSSLRTRSKGSAGPTVGHQRRDGDPRCLSVGAELVEPALPRRPVGFYMLIGTAENVGVGSDRTGPVLCGPRPGRAGPKSLVVGAGRLGLPRAGAEAGGRCKPKKSPTREWCVEKHLSAGFGQRTGRRRWGKYTKWTDKMKTTTATLSKCSLPSRLTAA